MKFSSEEEKNVIKTFLESDYQDITIFMSDNKINLKFEEEKITESNSLKTYIDTIKSQKQWTKNQHYVPQFYLKLFSNANGKIETLDKENKRTIKPQSVDHICSDNYFYSIETGKVDIISQVLENLFGYYENSFAEIYNKLVNDILNDRKIEDKDLHELCTFVTISHVRGKYFREQLENNNVEMMKAGTSMAYRMEKGNNPDDPEVKKISSDKELEKTIVKGDYNVEINNAHHIRFMGDEKKIRGFSNLLFNKKIRIYISNGERNFITSDNCIAEIVPERQGPYGIHFMDRTHYFVLSPKILIEFSSPQEPGKKMKRKRIGKDEVMYYNLIRSMFGKFLYSKSQDDFIKEEYIQAQANYLDLLYGLYPSQFQKDKDTIEQIKKIAKIKGISYKNNYDLIKIINKK